MQSSSITGKLTLTSQTQMESLIANVTTLVCDSSFCYLFNNGLRVAPDIYAAGCVKLLSLVVARRENIHWN